MKKIFPTTADAAAAFPSYESGPPGVEKKSAHYKGHSYERLGKGERNHGLGWKVSRIAMAVGLTALSLFLFPLLIKPYRKLVARLWKQSSSGKEIFSIYILKDNARPRTAAKPVEVSCCYILHEESVDGRRAFNWPTKESCLEPCEQGKIDGITSFFTSKECSILTFHQGKVSEIAFTVTTYPQSQKVKIAARMQITLPFADINLFTFHTSKEFDNFSAIPADLPQQFEKTFGEAAQRCEKIVHLLANRVTKTALEKQFSSLAQELQLKVTSFRHSRPSSFDYNADTQSLSINDVNFFFTASWTDGKSHYSWDDHRAHSAGTPILQIKNVDLDDCSGLDNRVSAELQIKFSQRLNDLKESDCTPRVFPDFSTPFGFNFLNDEPLAPSQEQFATALTDFEKVINSEEKFLTLELCEENMGKIREIVKEKYKKSALKHHPDRGGDEEKFKAIAGPYKCIEEYYKSKGLTW